MDKEVYKYTGEDFDLNQEINKDEASKSVNSQKAAKEIKKFKGKLKSSDKKAAPIKKINNAQT